MTPPPLLEASRGNNYLYLLRSLKDRKFYLGCTSNLKRRLDAHNQGLNTSTKMRKPFELVYCEIYPNSKLAKKREYQLKHNPNMFYYFKKRALCASLQTGKKEVMG